VVVRKQVVVRRRAFARRVNVTAGRRCSAWRRRRKRS